MVAKLLKGMPLACKIEEHLKREVVRLRSISSAVPTLISIVIDDDCTYSGYTNAQQKVAKNIGINYRLVKLPSHISQDELTDYLQQLNDDDSIHGIMIHKPIPPSIDYKQVMNAIGITKDWEGINAVNMGKMILDCSQITPCVPAAVMELVQSTSIPLYGKQVVIVGHSENVGKPLCLLFLQEMATVSICHVATSQAGHLADYVKQADLLVVAVGKPEFIKGEWIKDGAIVIDVGINTVGEKIVGDVDFEKAKKHASYITPVPGGVGPLTVAMSIKNGIELFKSQIK